MPGIRFSPKSMILSQMILSNLFQARPPAVRAAFDAGCLDTV